LGLRAIFLDNKNFDNFGFDKYSVIYGLIFFSLGLAYRFKQSLVAIIVMSGIILLDLVIHIITTFQFGLSDSNLSGIYARIVLVALFVKGGYYIILQRREDKTKEGEY
jgi:hypothetical protein